MMMMTMMMMVMKCFCGLDDRQKTFMPYFQTGPLSEIVTISGAPRARFEAAQNLSSDFIE